MPTTLSLEALVTVTGGNGPTPGVCTPDNPTGQPQQSRPTQYWENSRAAPASRAPNPPSYGNFFTNPKDLHGKANALADRFR
jgi:hypothetical protein